MSRNVTETFDLVVENNSPNPFPIRVNGSLTSIDGTATASLEIRNNATGQSAIMRMSDANAINYADFGYDGSANVFRVNNQIQDGNSNSQYGLSFVKPTDFMMVPVGAKHTLSITINAVDLQDEDTVFLFEIPLLDKRGKSGLVRAYYALSCSIVNGDPKAWVNHSKGGVFSIENTTDQPQSLEHVKYSANLNTYREDRTGGAALQLTALAYGSAESSDGSSLPQIGGLILLENVRQGQVGKLDLDVTNSTQPTAQVGGKVYRKFAEGNGGARFTTSVQGGGVNQDYSNIDFGYGYFDNSIIGPKATVYFYCEQMKTEQVNDALLRIKFTNLPEVVVDPYTGLAPPEDPEGPGDEDDEDFDFGPIWDVDEEDKTEDEDGIPEFLKDLGSPKLGPDDLDYSSCII